MKYDGMSCGQTCWTPPRRVRRRSLHQPAFRLPLHELAFVQGWQKKRVEVLLLRELIALTWAFEANIHGSALTWAFEANIR